MRFTLEHVQNTIQKHGDLLLSTEYKNYHQKLNITCHKCHKEYEQSFQMILKGYWCTEDCRTENYKNRDNSKNGHLKYTLEEVKNIVRNEGDLLISNEYKSGKEKLVIECHTCKQNFDMSFYHYNILSQRCPSCYIETRKLPKNTFNEYVQGRGDTLIGQYVDSRTEVKVKCGICQITFTILGNHYRQGGGCKSCWINRTRLTYDEVKSRVESFGDKLLSKTYINSKTPLQIECGNCGEVFQKTADQYTPFCKYCNSTSLEKMMIMYLRKHEIDFEAEKMYKDCRSEHGNMFRYDFYLPKLDCIIECDGQQHFEVVKKFKMKNHSLEEWFKVIQERDRCKTQYCIDNNIKQIRISYKEMENEETFEKVMKELLKRIETKNIVFSNSKLYSYLK
jgi:very-short-patch-repair endonuclease